MSDEEERSHGGSVIHRYSERPHGITAPTESAGHLDEVKQFLEEEIGPLAGVFHEIVSDKIHLDVLVFAPTAERDYWTFVTSGMSDLPMPVPEALGDDREMFSRAELSISLPSDWFEASDNGLPDRDQMRDERRYWPIRLLKWLARLPHEFDAWVWDGHSFPNYDPPTPYHETTEMDGAVLYLGFGTLAPNPVLELEDGGIIAFLTVVPVYGDEMRYKLNVGSDALLEKFDKHGVTDVLDPNRTSIMKRRAILGSWRKS